MPMVTENPSKIHTTIVRATLQSIKNIHIIRNTGPARFPVISGSIWARVFSIPSTLSTNIVLSLPLPFSSKYPIGSLSIFLISSVLISLSVLNAARCDCQVDKFIVIPLPSLHNASTIPVLTI